MIAEQTNVDTIANNLANVNTTGYKTERTEFKSLLYQTLQTKTTTANGEQKPVGAQVGLGTRVAATTSIYTQGSMLSSENATDFAIEGDGFFAVRGQDGEVYYTRSGNFTWSETADGRTILADAEGDPVLDTQGNEIAFRPAFPRRVCSSPRTAASPMRMRRPAM
jgi:flagellar basal-body rod protein FlgG